MYDSPIKTIQKDVEEQFENDVMKALFQMGVEVDREELIKALRYDRDQYNKGYQDGYAAGKLEWLKNNKVHLCDSCEYIYPACPCETEDVIFGGGEGNDNICACAKYKPKPAEQRTGKWVKMSDSDGEYYCCSECGEELPRYTVCKPTQDNPFPNKVSIERTRRCPYCGTKMEGENV